MPIGADGWSDTVRQNKICICNELGDKFHYLIKITSIKNSRIMYLSIYYQSNPKNISEILNTFQCNKQE